MDTVVTEPANPGFTVRDAVYIQGDDGDYRLLWIKAMCETCGKEFRSGRHGEHAFHLAVSSVHLHCPACGRRSMVANQSVRAAAGISGT